MEHAAPVIAFVIYLATSIIVVIVVGVLGIREADAQAARLADARFDLEIDELNYLDGES